MIEVVDLHAGPGATAFSTLRGAGAEMSVDYPTGKEAVGSRSFWGDGLCGNPYSGFNICHYTGDAPDHVADCRLQLSRHLGLPVEALIIPRQTHSINVEVIAGDVPPLEDTDALVTNRSDIALVVNTADCLPIVFNDPCNGVIGIAHAGWRGLYDGVIENCVRAMESIDADRSEIHAAIGPCICADCYEVDEEFADRFAAKFGDRVKVTVPGKKPHVDLRAAAIIALQRSGITADRVEVSGLCSRCETQLFSARRLGISSGRIATVIRKNR